MKKTFNISLQLHRVGVFTCHLPDAEESAGQFGAFSQRPFHRRGGSDQRRE